MWGISSNFYVAQSSHDVKIIFVNPTPLLTIKNYTKLFLLLLFLIYPKRLQPAAALDESSIWPSATGATTCIPCPTGSYNNSGGTCDLNTALTPSIQSQRIRAWVFFKYIFAFQIPALKSRIAQAESRFEFVLRALLERLPPSLVCRPQKSKPVYR